MNRENLTLHITGRKKQSDEGAALFSVRVHVIVIRYFYGTKAIHFDQVKMLLIIVACIFLKIFQIQNINSLWLLCKPHIVYFLW